MRFSPWMLPATLVVLGCSADPSDNVEPSDGGGAPDPRLAELAERAGEAPRDITVQAVGETGPMLFAEGAAVWVHPTDPTRSTAIVSSQVTGLTVFALDGTPMQDVSLGRLGAVGVDVRYDVPLGGERVALVFAADNADGLIRAFVTDPESGMLRSVVSQDFPAGTTANGGCMYQSAVDGKLYAFVVSKDGIIVQHELRDDGNGEIVAETVREIRIQEGNPSTEACVADDEHGLLYVVQEEEARILRYAAEPDGGNEATLVDDASDEDGINTEGAAIYGIGETGGYLIVPMQGGAWNFRVYTRDPSAHGGNNVYLGSFAVAAGNGFDEVTPTDALAVTNANLGGPFSGGMVLAQDRFNSPPAFDSDTNYKLVPWGPIAEGLDLLADPR